MRLDPTVDELLHAFARAVKEAPSRLVKRRLRQRLHKKLGAVLSPKDYEDRLIGRRERRARRAQEAVLRRGSQAQETWGLAEACEV